MKVTQIRKILRELAFDPRKPGHLKPIAEVGNPEYYRKRAIEFLMNGKKRDIENAITLLSLWLAHESTP